VIAFAAASAEEDLPCPSRPPDSIRIKVDENPLLQTSSRLKTLGHDVHATPEEGLSGIAEREIWEAAQREERYWRQAMVYGKEAQIRVQAQINTHQPIITELRLGLETAQ
jgi:hypothetical protein